MALTNVLSMYSSFITKLFFTYSEINTEKKASPAPVGSTSFEGLSKTLLITLSFKTNNEPFLP